MSQRQKPITSWDEVPVIFDPPFAGRLLGLDEATIRKYAGRGKLPAFKVGESWRFRREDIIAYSRGEWQPG